MLKCRIGRNTLINVATFMTCVRSITIGDDVLISYKCLIMDSDGHSVRLSERRDDQRQWRQGTLVFDAALAQPVTIGSGAWIGADSMILKGVRVGEGAIVSAGSVVSSDVPDWTIVAGNTARLVRRIAPDER